jgi:16S rRNA (uracil1498-N3)-methyltransferase
MPELFFCADISSPAVTLSDAEAHHAIHVLRLKRNDNVDLFDGAGHRANAVINAVDRSTVTAAILDRTFQPKPTRGLLTVAASPPKGDRLKWMIEKLTELGVDSYLPLQTARTIVDPRKTKLDKLTANVISAAKQSGQRWLREIAPSITLETLLAEQRESTQMYLAHPYEADSEATASLVTSSGNSVLLIGPEGGFTEREVSLAKLAGAKPICLPGTILRIETAAISFSAILKQRLMMQ